MGLAATIARRSLLGHPGRTLFSVLGVALGIATVVAVFTVDHVTVLSRTRWLDDADFGADLEVRPKDEARDPRENLLQLEGVAGVATFFQNDVRLRPVDGPDAGGPPRSVRLVALEAGEAAGQGIYYVERGRGLEAGDSQACLVGLRLAEDLGLEPGDRVLLSPPARAAKKQCVDGKMRVVGEAEAAPPEESFTVLGVLARESIGRRSKGNVVVMDFEAGRRLFRDVHVEPLFLVRRDHGVDLEALEAELNRGFTFERNQSAAVGQMADERAFRNGVRLAGLFALLLGLFVIFHTLSMSLLERVREVGALIALGTTRMQVARVFFSEALFVALLAGVLGFAGGLGIARLLLWEGITTLGVREGPVGPFAVPWHVTVPLTLLGVGIALVGSVFPILTARGADVVAILRGEEPGHRRRGRGFQALAVLLLVVVLPALFFLVVPVVGAAVGTLVRMVLLGLGVLGVLFAVALLVPERLGAVTSRLALLVERRTPLPALLASRSLAQSPTRIGASIAAVALVTSAFVGLKGMTNSLRGEIEVWGERAVAHKLFVEGLPDADLDALRAGLHELPEVVGVEQGDSRVYLSFLLLGLRTDELARYGPAARDPAVLRALEEEQAVVVSDRLARQRELAVGDTLLLDTSGHGVQEFRVAAISDEYGYFTSPDERVYAVTSDRHLARYFCLDVGTTTKAAVRLRDGADAGIVAAALAARFPGAQLQIQTGADVLRYHLEDIDRDFVLFDVILALTAALAGLGVLNGQLLAALERRKELGVLRALGMTRGQLAGAVLLESGILGVTGGVLGLLVGSALTPILVSALRVLSGLDLPLRGAGPALALFLVGALALALVAGLYPIWRMNRMDAVRAVRTG